MRQPRAGPWLPIVVGRDDLPIGMEGQMGCHSLLISLLLLESGRDRLAMGKRRVAALLNDEQRAVIASVPALEPTMDSVIRGRVAYARLFCAGPSACIVGTTGPPGGRFA